MSEPFVVNKHLSEAALWREAGNGGYPTSFDLEITARCNNACRHCYINLRADDREAKSRELSADQILDIGEEAASLGAVWCLITGGEPLLREDFADIYIGLKRKGLLVKLFTNANLVTEDHIRLFKAYPPRDIEVSVYGVTERTYEAVTRKSGSFNAFVRGLTRMLDSGIDVRLKAMALRSNMHEMPNIAEFCRERTKDYFRFDPWLHLRFDMNQKRNEEIKAERLAPEEFVVVERSDTERFDNLTGRCDEMLLHTGAEQNEHDFCNHLFHCGIGSGQFVISYDGILRLCSSLWHPDCVYDLRRGTLTDAYRSLVPKVRSMRSSSEEFMKRCRRCALINFCLWCPAHSYLETGQLDTPVDYFCQVAHVRARALGIEPESVGSVSV